MRVRILNHNAYGPFVTSLENDLYKVGTVHEVISFYPDTGEVDLGYCDGGRTAFAPSEYEVVGVSHED
jgi:hypothetical protein